MQGHSVITSHDWLFSTRPIRHAVISIQRICPNKKKNLATKSNLNWTAADWNDPSWTWNDGLARSSYYCCCCCTATGLRSMGVGLSPKVEEQGSRLTPEVFVPTSQNCKTRGLRWILNGECSCCFHRQDQVGTCCLTFSAKTKGKKCHVVKIYF